jgi:restriction system protein
VPIPDYESAMLPLLRLASDGAEHRFRDAVEMLATHFELTDAERTEMLLSGTAPLFDNRVGWRVPTSNKQGCSNRLDAGGSR